MNRFHAIALLGLTITTNGTCMPAIATEIDFVEKFALSQDREEALELLVPGSEDYYYFNALHLQNSERYDEVDQLLKRWVRQHGSTARIQQIQHRQALLTYSKTPQKTLDYLSSHLNLRFNHQREQINAKPDLPTSLDPSTISREAFAKTAFRRHRNLDGFSDAALDWLVSSDALDPIRRRHLLERLTRPDYEALPDLIVKDLNYKGSGGFGSLPIHRLLLKTQMDACLSSKPDLRNNSQFVAAYVLKLQPGHDSGWKRDPSERAAYLARLWDFAKDLDPSQNSLKAHILYHRLALGREQGEYDKATLMKYLRIPRAVGYLPREFRESGEARRFSANLSEDYESVTQLAPIVNDEPLVRDYLSHFFEKETNYRSYSTLIDNAYLKELFAETKIVHGLGDPEPFYAMLSPEKYRSLRDRVDLDFAASNSQQFRPNDPVAIDLFVKNVKTLIVKVYEVNTQNYYRQLKREVNTDINLDGLVANSETTHQYDDNPLRRVRRHFAFPDLNRPGTYVIDFIGNGQSSRVVVRKGQLRYVERMTANGHLFHVLNDSGQRMTDATLWVAGHEFASDENGDILVPFTGQPAREAIVLTADGRSSLHFFQHQSENFQLEAGIYVDRESLISNQKATVVVRSGLKVNGTPISITKLNDVDLHIVSTDHGGTVTEQRIANFQLYEDRDSEQTFQVPPELASVSFRLTAVVDVASTGKKETLTADGNFEVNGIQRSDKIDDLYFSRVRDQYLLDFLGKTGEPRANRPIQIQVKHRDFTTLANVTLQTDENGRIELGALVDIEQVIATSPSGQQEAWHPIPDEFSYRRVVHATADEDVLVPYLGDQATPQRNELSLLELRGHSFSSDHFDKLTIQDGYVVAKGLPPGDFDLWFKRWNRHVRIQITEGDVSEGFAMGSVRQLELRNQKPLQIAEMTAGPKHLTVRLQNTNPFTRVHVFATRFEPRHDAFRLLSSVQDAELRSRSLQNLNSFYLAGRNIGDEYQYILDRQYAKKFPGNMLDRPSLLLNPWDIRATETGEQSAERGEDYAASDSNAAAMHSDPKSSPRATAKIGDFHCMDFLTDPSTLLLNLVPDDEGVVTIDLVALNGHQQMQVVAIDPLTTVRRSLALPKERDSFRDLRLINGLDPQKHYTQQERISTVGEGEEFHLADITASKFVAYDSLESVYNLYRTLSPESDLAEFEFIIRWPELSDAERQNKYSEYACHELNFFLARKDPEFFAQVVRPYLVNKLHKTFMDRWLLGYDLQTYVDPWSYARLNVVERILLGRHVDGEQAKTRRHIHELFELLPSDVERWNQLFRTALRSQSLDPSDRFGVAGRAEIESAKSRRFRRQSMVAPHFKAESLSTSSRLVDGVDEEMATDGLVEGMPNQNARFGRASGRGTDNRESNGVNLGGRFFFEPTSTASLDQVFRKLDKTKEWGENNYYRLPISRQNADLVRVNAYWNDFAKTTDDDGFLSNAWVSASSNFTEMMFALATLDLPFRSTDPDVQFDGLTMTLVAKTPLIVVSEQIREVTPPATSSTPVLVSQNFYRHGERHRMVDGEQVDHFVTDEFLVDRLYGGQVVVTNTSSATQKVNVLMQIPIGAIAALNGRATRSVHVALEPYHTTTLDYHFYFPTPGDFEHFPVHVSSKDALLASAEPRTFHVVDQPTHIDHDSWNYVSQSGRDADVQAYLESHNVQQIDLTKIAFRMRDQRVFQETLDLLRRRHAYDNTLWSYGIYHGAAPIVQQFLRHQDRFVAACGEYLDSPLLRSDPVERHSYEQLDYMPVVNARTHQLGSTRRILNNRFRAQYHRLMRVLSQRRERTAEDLMSVTYYLLLQDRVAEAIDFFGRVDPAQLETRLQYDYFAAYLDCYRLDPQVAPTIVTKYANYPVRRWREAFANIRATLDEVAGIDAPMTDVDEQHPRRNAGVDREPSFDFDIEAKKIVLRYQNVGKAVVNFYRMDLELLFSRNPFADESSNQFSLIQPNESKSIDLPEGQVVHRIGLPEKLLSSNVLIEVVAGGKTKTKSYYATSLNVQIQENFGAIHVTDNNRRPAPAVYVKAYARMNDGTVRFFKDGYTDLRGKFDYASLNTNEIENVDRFSLLIMSDALGAVVREARAPKR